MDIKFKQLAIKESAPIIFNIYNAAFVRAFDNKVKDIAYVEDYLAQSVTYIGYLNNVAVCYFAYELQADGKVEFRTTGVLPEYQNMGIGKLILTYFLKLFPDKTIILVTHPKNIAALVLYLKNGFEICGWKDNYYGDGEPRLELIRK